MTMTTAELLNSLDAEAARRVLANCCAANAWVEGMLALRPFANDEAVIEAAAQAAQSLSEVDWLEAFAAHPLIGNVESLRQKYAATRQLAAGEHAGVAGADETTLAELAALNLEYHGRFGFIFIVFATGKTADEMLASLKSRIGNSRQQELQNAAAAQLKITQLRLRKLA